MKAEIKETYGVEVGDKITCHWENWEEDKKMKSTGIVYEVDHNHNFSNDVATFRFKNYKGNDCWFCGLPTKIIKHALLLILLLPLCSYGQTINY